MKPIFGKSERVTRLVLRYDFSAAHWNDNYGGQDIRELKEDLYKAVHGHTWTVEVMFVGEGPGWLVDEVFVRAVVMTYNDTFLPEHPAVKAHVTRAGLSWAFAGSTEQMAELLFADFSSLAARGRSSVERVRLYETPTIFAEVSAR